MLNTASLSLDQAPPISIPFRFFLTAPLFGLAAAGMMLFSGDDLFLTRWSSLTLGFTHLWTLGMLAMVMCGALLQMLPVIAGSPVPGVVLVGTLSHLMITTGTGTLVVSFLSGSVLADRLALLLLGGGITLFFVAVMVALWRVGRVSATVIAIRLALVSFLITLSLGLLLASGILGRMGFGQIASLVNVHLGWGILGWVGLLLVGISYQVVPMFQVTPEYPPGVRRFLVPTLFAGLVIWSLLVLASLIGIVDALVPKIWLFFPVLGFVAYALLTIRLQQQRKRRITDVTLLFWRTGMLFVPLCALLWLVGNLTQVVGNSPQFNLLLGIGLLLGVGLSVINGMLYKIVPFLSWFHLQNRQMSLMCLSVKVPNMKEFVPDRSARMQYYLFLSALLMTLLAALLPAWFARPAGLLFLVSNALLLKNLGVAMWRYRATNRELLAHAGCASATVDPADPPPQRYTQK